MKIWVSGSIARDLIMDFPGRFRDHIQAGKIHVLNLSFSVKTLHENVGGTGANIAYNLSLLGEKPELLGTIGKDQLALLAYFQKLGIGHRYVKVSRRYGTTAAYIITDRDDNQLAALYGGAMSEPVLMPAAKRSDWAIVGPEEPKNMVRLCRFYGRLRVNYIFDPGQQIILFSKAQLQSSVKGAAVVIGNDYEIGLVFSKLSLRGVKRRSNPKGSEIALLLGKFGARNDIVLVRTLGPNGSEIFAGGHKIKIDIAKPRRVLDPTGAGDAYRAGFLKGLILGYNLKIAGQLGATVASFAVEQYGTQNHKFNWRGVLRRHNSNFKEKAVIPYLIRNLDSQS